MIAFVLVFLFVAVPVAADEWPEELSRVGECLVCARRGSAHGAEKFVDWRSYQGESYGFCSQGCAESFDQMPSGYVPPVLPRSAPAFEWTTLDGATITPDGQSALLVDFWATWCAPCITAMPALEDLHRDFGGDLRVVGVSIDEKREELERFLSRRPLAYPVVHDGGDDPAWWQFRVPAIPAAFLLDGNGDIVAQFSGEVDPAALREAVEALVATD